MELLEGRRLLSISLDSGVLTVIGTAGRDQISFSLKSGDSSTLVVKCNSDSAQYAVSSVSRIAAYGGRGADSITAAGLNIPVFFDGGAAGDTLVGGEGADTLYGQGGNDLLTGGDGANRLRGGLGNDRIIGGSDADTIWGNEGVDTVNGGGGTDVIRRGVTASIVNTGAGTLYVPLYRYAAATIGNHGVYEFGESGLTPTQIRTAYGFGDLSDPSFTNRGAGQTIYIVDAFSAADVMGDLNIFSAQFGLPLVNSTTFKVYNAGGGQPAVDPEWAGEISLDVQWVHAIAPRAKIVLVQADSALDVDMLHAVQLAAQLSEAGGGGVVSMSFGAPEGGFYDPNYDTIFQSSPRTTFVASAGDNAGDLSHPAMNPNVLSVGGTLLYVDTDGNRIAPEVAWDQTGGGVSNVYPAPSYQQDLGYPGRAGPDVAYNADPDSGVAVYNSTPFAQVSGWMPGGVGGTSAGAPQWAALIALANQLRARGGQTTIGARANVDIYQIAQQFGPLAFTDITSGGLAGQAATTGFDLSTGWGTPHASNLISYLCNTNAPFLATPTSYTATLIHSSLSTTAAGNPLPYLITAMGGTGYASGSSRISLSFTAVPQKWDNTGLIANIVASDLYRSPANAAGAYRVYGYGAVDFQSYGAGITAGVPTGGPLKFDGWITVDAQGNEHIKVDFWAVDQFGNPWPTSPFKLAQLDEQTGTTHISFTGSFEG